MILTPEQLKAIGDWAISKDLSAPIQLRQVGSKGIVIASRMVGDDSPAFDRSGNQVDKEGNA